jgi:hypothetical protein
MKEGWDSLEYENPIPSVLMQPPANPCETYVKHETKETKPFRKHMNGNQSAFSAHLLTTTSSI